MVLNTIFGNREAEVSDNGYLSTATGDNLIQRAAISGDVITHGTYFGIFDNDTTTYGGWKILGTAAFEYKIIFDFGKRINKANITAYYSIFSGAGASCTNSWLSSLDGTTWTTLKTNTISPGETTEYKYNYAEKVPSMRYLKFNTNHPLSGQERYNGGYIYELKVTSD